MITCRRFFFTFATCPLLIYFNRSFHKHLISEVYLIVEMPSQSERKTGSILIIRTESDKVHNGL